MDHDSVWVNCWTVSTLGAADELAWSSDHSGEGPSARFDTERDSFPYKYALGSRHWPMDVHARESGSPMRPNPVAPTLRK